MIQELLYNSGVFFLEVISVLILLTYLSRSTK